MNVFHIEAEREQDETAGVRTWLVVAGNLFEAMSLVPDGYTVKSVEVQLDAVPGPGRVIGWMGPPPSACRPTQNGHGSLVCPTNRHGAHRAHEHRATGWPAQPRL